MYFFVSDFGIVQAPVSLNYTMPVQARGTIGLFRRDGGANDENAIVRRAGISKNPNEKNVRVFIRKVCVCQQVKEEPLILVVISKPLDRKV